MLLKTGGRRLTDNGAEFTDRLFNREKHASGEHEFGKSCETLDIEHRLSPPRHPQTNGMVECFNGWISEVLLTHRFESGQDLTCNQSDSKWKFRSIVSWLALQNHLPDKNPYQQEQVFLSGSMVQVSMS